MKQIFKRLTGIFMICLFLTSCLTLNPGSSSVSAASYAGYVMGYFTDAEYGLNLCYSTDGLHWTALNGGNAVMIPTVGQKGLRDPFIKRKQDGSFVIVATDMRGTSWGDHSQYIQCWDSDDLCSFNNARLLKMHDTAMHTWAPEVFYDYNTKQYGILWSGNTDRNRTYVNYTTDFKTVTSNQVFFDPGYDVIDADVIQSNGTAYLFYKDERSGMKRIKAAKSSTCTASSFSIFTPDFLTSANTEGPITFKDNNTNTWYMYADLFAQGGVFECWKTNDLNATAWTKVANISLQSGTKHGSIVPVTQAELDKIIAKWGTTTYYKLVNQKSGKLLDVNNGALSDGEKVIQQEDNGGYNQQWSIIATGNYKKLVNRKSGKVLDVNGCSTADGASVIQWKDNGGTNQQWTLTDMGEGTYKIINRNSQKTLEVSGGSTANGSTVVQNTDTKGAHQRWKLVPIQ